MTKVVFLLALVALVVGSIYAGTVIAAPKVETSGPVIMDTLSGEATQAGNGYIVQQNYSGVRHVSLTFYCWGIDCFNDEVYVFVGRMFGINYRIAEVNPTNYNSNYVVNVQFDADSWEIWANNGGPLEIYVAYKATVTYPR